jgi:hypothetical protein
MFMPKEIPASSRATKASLSGSRRRSLAARRSWSAAARVRWIDSMWNGFFLDGNRLRMRL